MRHIPVDAQQRLVAAPTKQPGLRWPLPIDVRLDELVERANESGANTSRQELLAALVLNTGSSGAKLLKAVVQLRKAKIGDVLIRDEVDQLPVHGPGRRAGSDTQLRSDDA